MKKIIANPCSCHSRPRPVSACGINSNENPVFSTAFLEGDSIRCHCEPKAKQSHPSCHCERPKVARQSHIFRTIPFLFLLFPVSLSIAQQTYNLEIVFQKTAWDSYPDLYDYGISLAGGDINGDGYSDIFVGASHWVDSLSWWAIDIYGFYGSAAMDTVYDVILHCPPHLGHNGSALCCGDLNGDSIGDVVVGDLGAGGNGKVRIYYGGSPFDTIVDMILNNIGTFGNAVASGDINGDQFDDLVVGSYTAGRVYVYYGGPLLDTMPDVVLSGIMSFGYTVGSGGDLNSDGFDDIVVGEYENAESYPSAGKVYVYFGGNPMDTIPDCWLHGEGVNHYLGLCNCDIIENQSDFDRLLTGTELWPNGFMSANSGKIYVLNGSVPMDTVVDWWTTGKSDTSFLGAWSTQAGNADNNEYYDILAGAPGVTAPYVGGIGYLWLGDSLIDTIPDGWMGSNDYKYYSIGSSVACAGDVNGDGYDEVMFSNYASDSNQTVWVCRYTGSGVVEQRVKDIKQIIQMYPSLITDKLTIKCQIPKVKYQMNTKAQMSLEIYDILGREVIKYDVENPEGKVRVDVDTRHLPAGVYFVQVEMEGIKEVQKVIKIK